MSRGGIGTSGTGVFINEDFKTGRDSNALIFKRYGVDNTLIDEGKNGKVCKVIAVHHWDSYRIVQEFCLKNGRVDNVLLGKLPRNVKQTYDKKDFTTKHQVLHCVMPRDDYGAEYIGKRGTKYMGVWIVKDDADKRVLREDSYKDMPIIVGRYILERGSKYGKSQTTTMLSTIRSLDFSVGVGLDCIEKMVAPSLGIFNNAIFGDGVLDTSADGITTFNMDASNGQSPVFPLYDMGDPTPLLNFLVPYMNDKISTASRVDLLLDMNSAKEMTAQESMTRYAIRSQSLSATLQQQEDEYLTPLIKRCISLLMSLGELGIRPDTKDERELFAMSKYPEKVIPQEVIDIMENGKDWFDIEFNNELSRIIKGQKVQSYMQFINALMMVAQVNPQAIQGANLYDWLVKVNEALGIEQSLMMDEQQFKDILLANQQAQQAQAQLATAQATSEIAKNNTQADKNRMEATNV